MTSADEYREQLRFLGTPDAEIEAFVAQRHGTEERLMVRCENRSAVLVFLAMQTQWDRAGMTAERCGLNYSRIGYVVSRLGLADEENEIFGKLRVMEQEALGVFASLAKRRHGRKHA